MVAGSIEGRGVADVTVVADAGELCCLDRLPVVMV